MSFRGRVLSNACAPRPNRRSTHLDARGCLPARQLPRPAHSLLTADSLLFQQEGLALSSERECRNRGRRKEPGKQILRPHTLGRYCSSGLLRNGTKGLWHFLINLPIKDQRRALSQSK